MVLLFSKSQTVGSVFQPTTCRTFLTGSTAQTRLDLAKWVEPVWDCLSFARYASRTTGRSKLRAQKAMAAASVLSCPCREPPNRKYLPLDSTFTTRNPERNFMFGSG